MFQRLKVPLGFARTLMGPYGVDRAVHSMEFTDCENGLGIKVIGGVKELTGEEFGVYVKRILPGGLAATDGNLMPGDQILEVNGDSLVGVTSERAVDVLRAASATNHMRLLIARDEEAKREFADLLEKYGSNGSTGSTRNSPIQQGGRFLDSTSSGSSSRSQSPLLLSPAGSQSMYNNGGPMMRSLSASLDSLETEMDGLWQFLTEKKEANTMMERQGETGERKKGKPERICRPLQLLPPD
ncbi:unnamed protein product [Menidia menidia]|uniref:(Atlantic silverside) hypothetical protein n=1 Tax=Menidia menidia TaxID=238744 RepID=A0A8S4AWC9_9TELE|nr:unnamed protein product [Menidia menidia]